MRRLVVATLLTLPMAAQAQSYVTTLPVIAVDREFWASFDAQHTDYREHAPVFDRERGWTPGFGVGARWMGRALGVDHVFVSVDYHHQTGDIDYIGSELDTGAPLRGTSGLTTDDVTGEIGRGLLLAPDFMITPVVQVGYHGWHRALTRDQTEDYSHVSVGAALRADYAVTRRLVATLRLGVAGMINPHIDIHYQGYYPQSLGGSAILQAGGKLDYALTSQIHVFTAANASHFSYGRSHGSPFGDNQILFEPSSTTTNVTLSGGVAYAF